MSKRKRNTRPSKNRRRPSDSPIDFERLEDRRVLAGNVNVLINDGILLVVGDIADNQVQIAQNSAGNVEVLGLSTTVNGSSDPFVVAGSFRHVTIAMGNGSDEVAVNGLDVSSNFSFYGGAGSDRLLINGLNARHFHAEGNQGDDVFEVNMNIRKSTYFYLGAGNDVISSENLTAGRNFKVFGHEGNDTISTEQLNVGRKLDFQLSSGNDQVAMTGDTNVRSAARIALGEGNDFAAVLPSRNGGQASFRGRLNIDGGQGADNIAFDPNVNVRGVFKTDGGDGTDALQLSSAGIGRLSQGGYESFQVTQLNNLLDQVFQRLEDVGIDEPVVVPLSTTITPTELTVVEQVATNIDSSFQIQGSDNVTGATVEIVDFNVATDELTFSTAGTSITGSFNSTSGLLAFSGIASTADYQQVTRTVQYRNNDDNPKDAFLPPVIRQFTIRIDTANDSVTSVRSFQVTDVNDPPVLILTNSGTTITPDDLPTVLDSGITVSDVDSEQGLGSILSIASAQIAITSGYVQGEDVLSVVLPDPQVLPGGGTVEQFISTFDAATGILRVFLNGGNQISDNVGSIEQWQTILRSATLNSQLAEPTSGTRTIQFTVNDGTDETSADLLLTVDADAQPNNFKLSQTTANGTVVGRIAPTGTFDNPTVYQVNDTGLAPVLQLNADDHISGSTTAPVVLVEYLDFQCPGCAAQHPFIKQFESDFDGELIVVRRHLPLESIHPNARQAALVSEAASQQGMFNEMADLLFENQSDWAGLANPTATFEGYATQLSLDLTQFQADVADADLNAGITADASDAASIGINGTPAFLLQGEQIAPASEAAFRDTLQSAVDDFNQPFVINYETGDIVLRDTVLLDAATTPTIELPVLVKDASGNTEVVTVTIRVTN